MRITFPTLMKKRNEAIAMKKKRVSIAGILMALCSVVSLMNGITVKADEYQSNGNVWLRSESSIANETSKICVIPKNTIISTIYEENGWGLTTYTNQNGTYSGWTALDLYTPLQSDYPSDIQQSSVKTKVYSYLIEELGFNCACADAIMTNMEYESSFNPCKESIDTNGLPSIGLFQWNGERCHNFKSFCNARELEYGSVDAQLLFLKQELTGQYCKQYETMLNFENNADGCYDASYYWASKFEVCSSVYWKERAETASKYYSNHYE